jgi:hypothetical protein
MKFQQRVSRYFSYFANICAPHEKKEAGMMPSSARGAASPWFTGVGLDLLVKK